MIVEMLATQFKFTHFVIHKNGEDISHAESLRTPRAGGNGMNWVLGHILFSRDGMLQGLGEDRMLTEEEATPYRRGSSPITAEVARDWPEMLAAFDVTQERLTAALEKLDEERLKTMVPAAIGGGEEPLSEFLASLAFHEAYHAGQMGVLRRTIGKPGVIT